MGLGVLGVILFNVIAFWMVGVTRIHGQVHASGAELGDWQMVPRYCHTGQRAGYFGVEMGDGERRLRLVRDPVSDEMTVSLLQEPKRELRARDRAIFDVRLERQASGSQTARNMEGRLRIDCESKGGRLSGEVTFENCL